MHYVHNLDPIIFHWNFITVRWYGFMYLVGFVLGLLLFRYRHNRGLFKPDFEQSQILVSYLMIGMMICARLFYVAVYNPSYYMQHPEEIPAIWMGGLSFHGAAIGFALAMIYFGRNYKVGFFHLADSVALGAAQGIFWGRIGNFINGELYGRVSDVPWAVVFPAGGPQPRHPSQLYQGLLEGLGTFFVLWLIQRREIKKGYAPQLEQAIAQTADGKRKKKVILVWKRTGVMGASFLICYGVARSIVEFFREPDAQLGYFGSYFTMGQILCLIMIIVGIFLLRRVINHPIREEYEWHS